MLHPVDLNLGRVARTLDERFPELAPSAPVTVLDHGLGSVVIQTAGAVIFRIGRDARSYEGYCLEHRLLPVIAARLPIESPAPRWLIEPCDDFASGAIGYSKIEGRTLSLELSETSTMRHLPKRSPRSSWRYIESISLLFRRSSPRGPTSDARVIWSFMPSQWQRYNSIYRPTNTRGSTRSGNPILEMPS